MLIFFIVISVLEWCKYNREYLTNANNYERKLNYKRKILQLVAFHRDVKENFFSKIGMTNGNFKGENKKKPINSDAIVNILAQYPEISAEWLLTGKGKGNI